MPVGCVVYSRDAADRFLVLHVAVEPAFSARGQYSDGDVLLRMIGAVRAAARIYRGIGAALARQGYQPLAGRAYLPGRGKAAQVLIALAQQLAGGFTRAPRRAPRRVLEFGAELCPPGV